MNEVIESVKAKICKAMKASTSLGAHQEADIIHRRSSHV
jgi:hypothetical protein